LKSGLSRFVPLRTPRWALTLLLAIACSCYSSLAQDQPAADAKITVRGIVINSLTREPVGHALVYSSDNRLATFTDDQGHFEFVLPLTMPEATANSSDHEALSPLVQASASLLINSVLNVRKPGFLNLPNRFWTPPPDPANQILTLTLIPESLIVGRVVIPNSNSADRIQVNLYRRQVAEGRGEWLSAGSSTTRSSGEFRFADLEPGTYKLFTGEQMDRDPLTFDPRGPFFGYPPAYFPNATDFETAATIQITPGMTLQAELSPVRQPYYTVKIPVTNASSDTQLMVNVSMQGHRGPGFTLGYNNQSQKIEGSLPNGTYVIEATSVGPNYAYGSSALTVKGGNAEGSPLTLTPLGSVRINARLDFKVEPDSGASQEPSAQPAEGQQRTSNLNVRLERAEEIPQQNDFVQMRPPNGPNDDSLVFDNVAPGRYWVRVTPNRGFAASISAGNLDLLRHPLTVGPGANIAVDVTLREDGAEIAGSIEGLDNAPTETDSTAQSAPEGFSLRRLGQLQAYVYCIPLPDSAGQFRETQVSSDGKFNLQQVPPGSYRVLAFDHPQQHLEYRNGEAMRTFEAKGQDVRLVAGQKETVRLPLIVTSD
jgi:hypothetical protein